MLIELSIANFRSFRDRVTLSLEAERISERDKSVDVRNVAHTNDGDLLRVIGVYGANASGKSNLVTALSRLRGLVLNSTREGKPSDSLNAEPFRLDPESRNAPSELEVVFIHRNLQVRYGVAFTTKQVEREWLFVRPVGTDAEERWFERVRNDFETGGAWVRDTSLEKKTRPEVLHLTVAADWNHDQSLQILEWFQDDLLVLRPSDHQHPFKTIELLEDERHADTIRAMVRRLDFGIDDIRASDRPVPDEVSKVFDALKSVFPELNTTLSIKSQRRLETVHREVVFDLQDDESAGTAMAIALVGPIVEVLSCGGVLVVDEFNARLHTLLAKQLIELFQDSNTNPRNAQLIFTSHDTNLLTRTLLRRDQLWFVEKSHRTHSSDLYSLAEFRFEDGKGVRNDANYERDYLQGRYGAIPFFGGLRAILGDKLTREAK
jgi:energy-coupling factor transporter ATP-binding protein EcfA2